MILTPLPPDDRVYLSSFWPTKATSVLYRRLESKGYRVGMVYKRWDGIHVYLLDRVSDLSAVSRKLGIRVVGQRGCELLVTLF